MPSHSAIEPKDPSVVMLAREVLPVWIRQLATSRTQSEEAVAAMLSAFSHMSPLLRGQAVATGKPEESAQPLIERMYVGFQYQDRISQMMGLLLDDMQRLLQVLENPAHQHGQDIDPALWLERLQSQYAMAEQRRDHSSSLSGHSNAEPSNTNGETEFF